MNPTTILRQILSDWVQSLPIDGETGESIVTLGDIDQLYSELLLAFESPGRYSSFGQLLRAVVCRVPGHLRHGLRKRPVSLNFLRPL